MIKKLLAAAMLTAGFAAAPAYANPLAPGTQNVTFTTFDLLSQGTQLASKAVSGCSGPSQTFCGTMGLAVYRNTLGTLDFYYQFTRLDDGKPDPVEKFTGSSFTGFSTDAFATSLDADGLGNIFTVDTNLGSDATASRTPTSGIVSVNFDINNPISAGQSSATYIFRTDAIDYTSGFFGAIDGQTFSGSGYMPVVPEPSTWAMMMLGFGAVGALTRRKRKGATVVYA